MLYALVAMSAPNVTFHFENRRLQGVAGEPIAKALFRAGVRTLSWSVKYKRPRSIQCARGRCVMCHLEVDGTPGVPSCITPLEEGMRVRRESFRPFFAPPLVWSARLLHFPAGFYYRMFTRPAFLRKIFLGTLRRMAGVGRLVTPSARRNPPAVASARPGAERMPAREAYDVIVAGAGLSGMSAAVSAARAGSRVLLVDEYARPGGHSLGFHADDAVAATVEQQAAEMLGHDAIHYLRGTTAQAFYPPNRLLLGPSAWARPVRTAMKTVRAETFIFATGAYDIIPVFGNNDLPGIFGARAIRLLLERDGLIPGSRAVVYGTGAALEDLAGLLARHGIETVAIVDAASAPRDAAGGPAGASPHRIGNARVTRAEGRRWISGVTVRGGHGLGKSTRIECDVLCTAFAGQGAYELAYQAGFRFALSEDPVDENRVMLPEQHAHETPQASYFVVGELAGQRRWQEKTTAGEEAGARAAGTPRAREKR